MSVKTPMVAIIGRPNVGKSSIFNRISGYQRAIVAREAHTTRDNVSQLIANNNRPYYLLDTAGMERSVSKTVSEQKMTEAILDQVALALSTADILLVTIDGQAGPNQIDKQIAKRALKTKKPVILLVNKLDKSHTSLPSFAKQLGISQALGLSAAHNLGFSDLNDLLMKLVPQSRASDSESSIKLAIIGRPNVGKSMLFNSLTGAKSAVVSPVSGTTRDSLSEVIKTKNGNVRLYDTGGVRRPGKREPIEKFSYVRTLWALEQADIAILVIEPDTPTALDQKLAAEAAGSGKGLIIAINKWDQIENPEAARQTLENRLSYDFAFVAWAPIVYISALTGLNLGKIAELGQQIMLRRRLVAKTSDLNDLLQNALINHPPAGLKGHQPKLKYAVQTGQEPPTFTFFGAGTKWLHWSYKRYLDNQLRAHYDLIGTPLKLSFKSEVRTP